MQFSFNDRFSMKIALQLKFEIIYKKKMDPLKVLNIRLIGRVKVN